MSDVATEIASQPDCWRRAGELAAAGTPGLPAAGERVAAVGCGTSWFMAAAFAGLREARGAGETDAFAASEFPLGRRYDRVLAITRSGTTSEVLALLAALRERGIPTTAIIGDPHTPVVGAADHLVTLDFADERSVVQTRFATSVLALLRAHLGDDVATLAAAAEGAVGEPLPPGSTDRRQYTFLGRGWSVAVATEAALKMREASLSWSESYPAMEYRHGPMSITDEGSQVWLFGVEDAGLVTQIEGFGAQVVRTPGRDPMVELVRAQRLAVAVGEAKGLDPDHPRHLSRSVVLK